MELAFSGEGAAVRRRQRCRSRRVHTVVHTQVGRVALLSELCCASLAAVLAEPPVRLSWPVGLLAIAARPKGRLWQGRARQARLLGYLWRWAALRSLEEPLSYSACPQRLRDRRQAVPKSAHFTAIDHQAIATDVAEGLAHLHARGMHRRRC